MPPDLQSQKSGDQVGALAQILGLAREFDELLQHGGAGEEPLSQKEALLKVAKLASHQFSKEVVDALLTAFRRGRLFDQEVAFFEVPL